MKKIFTKSSIHGDLFFKSIYDYFDGPKLFSVMTNRGKLLLVYWIDEDDDSYTWIALDITKSRLIEFESKKLDINWILSNKQDKFFYKITTPFNKKEHPTIRTIVGDIDSEIIMPDKGIFISMVEALLDKNDINEILDEMGAFADYSLHIDRPKDSKAKIDFKDVSPVFDTLDELLANSISAFKMQDKLIPVSARPGSFIVDFNSSKFNMIERPLSELTIMIKARNPIGNFIKKNKIPLQALEKLFLHVSNENLVIDIKNINSNIDFLKINKLDSDHYLKEISKLSACDLNSWQVPQADTLCKVFELVNNIWSNGFLDRSTIGLSDRHIRYYNDAARLLGFISATGSITSLGQQLVSASKDVMLSITAKCFENSHCGWTWIVWSGVSNFSEIDPTTAEKFLGECAITLSDSTIKRRSRTLRKWCNDLQEHYKTWD
ncbi:DUF6575 domain-containing protein [Yersinia enterocolitica]|uniref:DUF6575 domain-containing protein n=1 Tax=Yersinia enterocolitica TaxID=630 RepID=UPI00398C9359